MKPPSAKKDSKKERAEGFGLRKQANKRGYDKTKKKFKGKTSHKPSSTEKCLKCIKKDHKTPDCPRNKRKKKKINRLEVDKDSKKNSSLY